MSDELIGTQDLREVRLYGHLGKRFGRVHQVAVKSAREATVALCHVLDGFEAYMLQHNAPGFHVFTRRVSKATNLAEEQLDAPLGAGDAVCVVPVVAGAKKGGLFKIILGVALVFIALTIGGGVMLLKMGALMALGGVLQLLTPVRKGGGDPKSSAQAESYHFDGPLNNTQQGMPIQVIFGEMIVGSSVVSQGITASDLAL